MTTQTAASYDRVAEEYVRRIYDELKDKPLDRELLDRLAERTASLGSREDGPWPICDLGCGPGQVARYLRERGVSVCGIDLSAGMVEQARRLNPAIRFEQGDMLALDVADSSFGGIAAFYSIIHVPRPDVVRALRELRRVLCPGGWLLVAFHIGQEVVHLDAWWGHDVSVDFVFFEGDEMEGCLRSAGFEVEPRIERAPYEGIEHPSRRAYVFARKPG